MHRLFLRPLTVFLTLLVLVIALAQAGGRIVFSVLDELEPLVNQWLTGQRATVTGLSGDWRGLNPIVRIDRVDVPAGYVSGIYVELDWLESITRSAPVAERVQFADAHLTLERTDRGWRLKDAQQPIDFDFAGFLYHSNALEFRGRVGLLRQAADTVVEDLLDLVYLATNVGGRHQHRLQLTNPLTDCAADCALRLALDETEALWPLRGGTRLLSARGQTFVVPQALIGPSSLALSLNGAWEALQPDAAGGSLLASFGGLDIGRGAMAGEFLLSGRFDGERYRARLDDLVLTGRGAPVDMPSLWLSFGERIARWWTPELDLGSVLGFVARHVPSQSPAGRWLNGLALEADALNVRGYVDTGSGSVGYATTIRDLSMTGFAGAPSLEQAGGELVGHGRGMQIVLNAEDMDTYFPGFFHNAWLMKHAQGVLQAWWAPRYFAMRGRNMRLAVGESLASGGFALSRLIGQPMEDRLTLLVHVDESTVPAAMNYFPRTLPAGLPEWLESGPRAGNLSDLTLAYHGHLKVRPFELARRVELATRIDQGHVEYHPDWPDLLGLDGRIAVAGSEVRIAVDRGVSEEGATLDGSRVVLGDNAAFADVVLSTETSLENALGFIRRSPLSEWLTFVTPSWSGAGRVSLDGTMHVPLQLRGDHIGESSFEEELEVNLQIGLSGVDLALPDYRVALGALNGVLIYEYPNNVRANGVRGEMFGRPAIFGAEADDDTVIFSVAGQSAYADALAMLDMADPGVMRGGFDFLADLHIELSEAPSRLEVISDLTGLALDLPGEFAKLPEESVDTFTAVHFHDEYEALEFRHRNADGWLHVNETPLRGAIGFATPAPGPALVGEELLLTGWVGAFGLDEVIPDDESGTALLLPIRLADLRAEAVELEELYFAEVLLEGTIGADALDVSFDSADVTGTVSYVGDAPLELHLVKLNLPAGDEGEDPLDPSIIRDLPRANVLLDQVTAGGADYGAWSFDLLPDADGVAMKPLEANLRGIAISAPEGVYWRAQPNTSHFEGQLLVTDLAQVLPQWDIAPTVATESAELEGTLSWRGSPGNVEIERLFGQASFSARNGRFIDVDAGGGQGAMRLVSLVNFGTLFKRLNLDFSDVVGEGISFDTITGAVEFEEGLITFVEPMVIDGSGSSFKIAGQVDLNAGTLDNEVIVTLPVTRSLPWYAAYIALASPLTAIGVLVGERVLRKPIEQFSSAKYHLTGPIEDPDLSFLNVWDTSVDEPKTALEEAPIEPEEPPQPGVESARRSDS